MTVRALSNVCNVSSKAGCEDAPALSFERRAALKKTFEQLSTGPLTFGPDLPAGVRFATTVLQPALHPDGYAFRALVPAGVLIPGEPVEDPNQAKTFYIERSGGFAGRTSYAGPFVIGAARNEIAEAFHAARSDFSEAGSLVSRHELFDAFRAAKKDDGRISQEDKETLALEWASLFDGSRFQATPAAERAYSVLQSIFDLPVFPVH